MAAGPHSDSKYWNTMLLWLLFIKTAKGTPSSAALSTGVKIRKPSYSQFCCALVARLLFIWWWWWWWWRTRTKLRFDKSWQIILPCCLWFVLLSWLLLGACFLRWVKLVACSVHPDDYHLLDVCWDGHTYVDRALPFGLCSAPKIFSAFANFIAWVLHSHEISHQLHYLDDFCSLVPLIQRRLLEH